MRAASAPSTTSAPSGVSVACRPSRSRASRSAAVRGVRTTTPPPAAVRLCTVPCWTIRPRWITTTSSTVCATSARTWLETSTVRPSAAIPRRKSAQPADALRIEAVGRLVEDQDARVAEQRRGEPEPLAHAERVLARAPVGGVRELDERQDLVDARTRQPGHGGQRAQVVAARAAPGGRPRPRGWRRPCGRGRRGRRSGGPRSSRCPPSAGRARGPCAASSSCPRRSARGSPVTAPSRTGRRGRRPP